MKTNSPKTRLDLHIKKGYKVLEIGPGSNPTYRADVVVDKFLKNNPHRSGNIRIFPHQQFINAAAEALPFADKEFDYVICNHVLEHSDDPAQFIREITRVGKAGYIETPSLLGEWLFPDKSHRYVVLSIDGKLVLHNKNLVTNKLNKDLLKLLPHEYRQEEMKRFSGNDLLIVRYEWKENIEFVINPEEERLSRFFHCQWDRNMIGEIDPKRNCLSELYHSARALACHITDKLHYRRPRYPLSLEEHRTLNADRNRIDE